MKETSNNDPLIPRPPYLINRYRWVEVVEHDVESGLVAMLGMSLFVAFVSLAATCSREEREAADRSSRGQPGSYGSQKRK